MLIYINYLDLNKVTCVGIKKKILAQCRALKKKFKEVYYTIYSGQMIYLLSEKDNILEKVFAITMTSVIKQ